MQIGNKAGWLVLAGITAMGAGIGAGERKIVLGKDDLTGEEVSVTLGKAHPFVAWTKAEVDGFRQRLENRDRAYKGTRYGWTHPKVGPVVKAKQGDPVACGKVWLVTGDLDAAKKAAEFLLDKARKFEPAEFVELGCWNAPRELQKCTIVYDLIAGSQALSADEHTEVRRYLRAAMQALKEIEPQYGAIHNIGFYIDQSAWTAALCLGDEPMLRELFARFRDVISQGLLTGGYWYEGTAYGNMVRGNVNCIIERAARSGLQLASLNCKRKALSAGWTVPEGYVRPGDIFEWPYRVVTPFREIPNIGDGGGPRRLHSHAALKVAEYTRSPEFVDRYYAWDLGVNKVMDPHVWGDYPPNPDVPPLERLGDVAWPELGMFVFRQGNGLDPDGQYILFHALPRTGYHPHSDQGHLSIARYGKWLTGDPESSARSTGYQKLRDAFSATRWAHNTVVVGGQWGKKEIDFPKVHYASATDPEATVQVADLTVSDFTRGPMATQRRCVLVTDDFIVVTDDLTASEETTFDWFFHGAHNAKWSLAGPPARRSIPLSTTSQPTQSPTTTSPGTRLPRRTASGEARFWSMRRSRSGSASGSWASKEGCSARVRSSERRSTGSQESMTTRSCTLSASA